MFKKVELPLKNAGPSKYSVNHIKISPCQACGACCSFFRVSFPESETDDTIVGRGMIPYNMTSPSKNLQRYMNGTQGLSPHCIALEGKVGVHVKCRIYPNRPSACRQFKISWENNTGNSLCDRARSFFGLQPFSQY